MTKNPLPFSSLAQKLLADLADGNCVSISGLSNSGKSMLMRSLASEAAEEIYSKEADRSGFLVYIDCNRAVANSAQAFYEVVLRSIIERLTKNVPAKLLADIQEYHLSITEAETSFRASLSFNLALSDLCDQLDRNLCLLFDEFDEIYVALDDRALLNLRALRDRFHTRLVYATATLHSLPQLRSRNIEDEFAEMFSRFTYNMPLLISTEAAEILKNLNFPSLTGKRKELCMELSGGHPGLLVAVAQALSGLPKNYEGDMEEAVLLEPQPRAECLKIWSQIDEDDRAIMIALVIDAHAGIPQQQLRHVKAIGLVVDGKPFSPIFSDFVGRKGRGSHVETEGVYLDSDSGDVWVDGIRIPVLTDLEFRLLELLYLRRDKLTDKYRIVTSVWGEDYLGQVDDARVEKLISRLRSKIEPDPAKPRYLITRRGRGYKLLTAPMATESLDP